MVCRYCKAEMVFDDMTVTKYHRDERYGCEKCAASVIMKYRRKEKKPDAYMQVWHRENDNEIIDEVVLPK